MDTLKLGFAGVGFMGQLAHLQNYARVPGCEIVAIAEPRRKLAEQVAEKYHLSPRFYASHQDLIDDPDVEAVVASQPYLLNGYIAIPLLKAGKSVFIEKPMAGSFAEAASMVEAAEAEGALLMVGFMKRYDSGVNLARERLSAFLASGELGEPGLVSASCFCGDWLRGIEGAIQTDEPVPANLGFVPQHPEWLPESRHATFESYMNIFSHNVNLIRFLLPGTYKTRGGLLRENALNQVSLLQREDTMITLHGMGVQAGWWEERTEVYFDRGWVRVATASPMEIQGATQVEIYQGGAKQERAVMQGKPYWAFRAQAEHFVECVRTGQSPLSSGRDSLEDMRLMEDVFRLGQWY